MSAVIKNIKQGIARLKNESGEWVEDVEELKSMARNFFKKLYTAKTSEDIVFLDPTNRPWIAEEML